MGRAYCENTSLSPEIFCKKSTSLAQRDPTFHGDRKNPKIRDDF